MLLYTINLSAQIDSTYSKFLIIKTQSIDYYPVWGKNDNEIYINLTSQEWRKYDLSKCKYIEGTYYAHNLAINTAENWVKVSNQETIQQLEADKNWKPREIKDKKGNVFTLEVNNYNTTLFVQEPNKTKIPIMNIKGNAHSMAISRTGKYFACIFELSGLMIFEIEKELKGIKATEKSMDGLSNLDKAEHAYNNRNMELLEKTISNCTQDEKQTNSYNYYYGLILYIKSEKDSSLIQEAIKYLSKSQDDSRFYDSNVLISYLYQNKNDLENSFKYAERAIEKIPDHPSGYRLMADYYKLKGDEAKACEFYKQAFEKGDEMAQIFLVNCN
jgi:tetratricopeptide (TPR) repeat protein